MKLLAAGAVVEDGQRVADVTYSSPGSYSLDAIVAGGASATAQPAQTTVTITVDKTFSVPGDQRRLGVIVNGIGFR